MQPISPIKNNFINNLNFKGYSARPMRAIVMRNADNFELSAAAKELRQIGMEHGFSVILEDEGDYRPWIQDVVYFTKDKMIINKDEGKSHSTLCKNLNREKERIPGRSFIAGGNLYLIKDGENEKILLGANERIKKAQKLFPEREIIQIPQADFHIDLFVRPLKGNTILAADDDMTIEMLENAKKNLKKLILENPKRDLAKSYDKLVKLTNSMEKCCFFEPYVHTEQVINTLEAYGFNVVRTPGRVYEKHTSCMGASTTYKNKLNFINAIATVDDDGEIVYISNKSDLIDDLGLDEETARDIGLDFEGEFKDAVWEYINPENIYFVEGAADIDKKIYRHISSILEDQQGGIHCLSAEIPRE